MENTENEIQTGLPFRGMAAHILEEVIIADMSMHSAQIELWKKFGELRPFGNQINPDIHLGFAEERYLCLNEVKLTFYIRQISLSIYNRLKVSLKLMFGLTLLPFNNPVLFDLCSASDKNAMAMTIIVKRFENGTISAEYMPADDATNELLKNVKIDFNGSK